MSNECCLKRLTHHMIDHSNTRQDLCCFLGSTPIFVVLPVPIVSVCFPHYLQIYVFYCGFRSILCDSSLPSPRSHRWSVRIILTRCCKFILFYRLPVKMYLMHVSFPLSFLILYQTEQITNNCAVHGSFVSISSKTMALIDEITTKKLKDLNYDEKRLYFLS